MANEITRQLPAVTAIQKAPWRKRFSAQFIAGRFGLYILVAIICLAQFFPIIWSLLTSFMTPQETLSIPAALFPSSLNLTNYASVFNSDMGRYYLNSVIVSIVSATITMTLASLASYAFARLKFRMKTLTLVLTLALSFFPPLAQVLPLYSLLNKAHLINTLWALIVPYSVLGLPLAVLILTAFFRDIPGDLEEAAMVDGLTRFKAFYRIILPLSAPGFFTTFIIVFVANWNEFLFALNYTTANTYTLPVGIVEVSQTEFTTNFGVLSAATTLAVVPLVILILLLERRIVSGLTSGAVKG